MLETLSPPKDERSGSTVCCAAVLDPPFTYIVGCEGSSLLKFGKSRDPQWRLTCMQTGCPEPLRILWQWREDIESQLHAHFASRRIRGEWFDVPLNEAIEVAAVLTKKRWRECCDLLAGCK